MIYCEKHGWTGGTTGKQCSVCNCSSFLLEREDMKGIDCGVKVIDSKAVCKLTVDEE